MHNKTFKNTQNNTIQDAFLNNCHRSFFPTLQEVGAENISQLKKVNNPIIYLKGVLSNPNKPPRERDAKLLHCLHICIGAVVMLNMNISVRSNLVNGSIGIVKEIVYDDSVNTNALININYNFNDGSIIPSAIIVEFNCYSGVPLITNLNGVDRSKWIPITPISLKYSTSNDFIEQFPLFLGWSTTIHKAQGATIRGLYRGSLGSKEISSGITYTLYNYIYYII